ncbi:hypothetical protein [Thiocystis violascens]|uniref:hypothetical protein n=1 Tax=Thiocystis violascens TaxID=73141 RepID=UPI0002F7E580|nr:hypothetical protein [Thiocystis violascens]
MEQAPPLRPEFDSISALASAQLSAALTLSSSASGVLELAEKLKDPAVPTAGALPVPLAQLQETLPLPVSVQVQLPLAVEEGLLELAPGRPQVRIRVAVVELAVLDVPAVLPDQAPAK